MRLLKTGSGNNVSEITIQLIKQLGVPVTKTTVIDQVEGHPDFPSLLSISDNLRHWEVESMALQVEPEQLDELPTPFLAHMRGNGGNFSLVNKVGDCIELVDDTGKKTCESREAFMKNWTTTVLLAEKNATSGEENYKQKRKREFLNDLRVPVLLIAGIGLCFLPFFSAGLSLVGLFTTVLLLLKLAGVGVTGLLFWFEIDRSNPLLRQICGGQRSHCASVLNSKAAKITSWLSWSDVGFFYFFSGFLFLLLSGSNPYNSLSWITWLNLAALPYTFFSIYYQWRVAKTWCPLCLAVQGLLVAEFLVCLTYFFVSTEHPSWGLFFSTAGLASYQLPILAFAALFPILFRVGTKAAFVEAQKGKFYKKEYSKLKYNREIFSALLQKQRRVTQSPEGLGIRIDSPGARHLLIKVCNPYCGPCARAHGAIDELIKTGLVNVQIIFTATNHPNDKRAAPVKHLMAIYEEGDREETVEALHDWYSPEVQDYEVFQSKYEASADLDRQSAQLEAMHDWCEKMEIAATPTLFFDGFELPESYSLQDLKYFLLAKA